MKKLATLCLAACLAAALATPAGALDYAIDAPEGPDYGKPTSVEVVHTADGGALKNEDISKNAALIPPGFGSASADTLNTGTWLTPNLAPEGMAVRVYEGTDSSTLMKGAGHFKGTSIWDGNCAIAGHNRGVRDDFGDLHTLERGDTITWTTKLGVRTYEVTSVQKVKETDTSGTAPSNENKLTLYTCVRNQRTYRWQVQAAEVV